MLQLLVYSASIVVGAATPVLLLWGRVGTLANLLLPLLGVFVCFIAMRLGTVVVFSLTMPPLTDPTLGMFEISPLRFFTGVGVGIGVYVGLCWFLVRVFG